MNFNFRNRRQFDLTLSREGQEVTDYYTGNVTTVFFRRIARGTQPLGKIRIYYAQDSSLDKGSVIKYKNKTYVLVNKDAQESDFFYSSVALECTETFLMKNSQNVGKQIPFVVSELRSASPKGGGTVSYVGGALTLYTGYNNNSEQYLNTVELNSRYVKFGGTYEVVNTYYNDGLYYMYFMRVLSSVPTDTYAVNIGSYYAQYTIGDALQLSATTTVNSIIVENQNLTWASSDENVATIDSNGNVTFLTAGNVTFTVTWVDHNVSKTTDSITVNENASNQMTCTITYKGDASIIVGGNAKTFTAVVTDSTGADITSTITDFTWSISNYSQYVTLTPTGNTCKLKCAENDKLIRETLDLTVIATKDDSSCEGKLTVTLASIY